MTAIRSHAPDASDAAASDRDDARPLDFDDDPSIAIELMFEWYAALLMGFRLRVGGRYPPPEGLVERASARHHADSSRLFLDHWHTLANTQKPLTKAAHAFAAKMIVHVIRIALDAAADGALSPVDLDRLARAKAIEQSLKLGEAFHVARADGAPQ